MKHPVLVDRDSYPDRGWLINYAKEMDQYAAYLKNLVIKAAKRTYIDGDPECNACNEFWYEHSMDCEVRQMMEDR